MKIIRSSWVTPRFPTGDFVHRVIEEPTCIINVGHDVVEKPPFFMNADGAKVIHVNFKRPTLTLSTFHRSR